VAVNNFELLWPENYFTTVMYSRLIFICLPVTVLVAFSQRLVANDIFFKRSKEYSRFQVGYSFLPPVVVCPGKVYVNQDANYSNRYHPRDFETKERHFQVTGTEEECNSGSFFREIREWKIYSNNYISTTSTKNIKMAAVVVVVVVAVI
jgi:hypothetical protein